jgi:EAL domain-containing protein (putative c-di-GMP-specific phosphodiesterase class I)
MPPTAAPATTPVPTAAQLEAALARGEIRAAFQPKVTLATGALAGVEALARWTDPELGSVPPSVFIPLAEQSGLIGALTGAMLREAIGVCVALRRRHPAATVALNLSPVLLGDPGLPACIAAMLDEAGLPPTALIVEVTEGRPIADDDTAGRVLGALRAQGVDCAIDDFGIGHANLEALLRLPFNELKIDRSFVAQAAETPEAWTIVRATIRLARELRLRVVAEGIETDEIERRLREAGCEQGQGYRYGCPMPREALLARLCG